MSLENIYANLQRDWRQLLHQADAVAPSRPKIRTGPVTLSIELEDVLAEWRELWASEWFASELGQLVTSEWTLKDLIAHVASWAAEFRAQMETMAAGSEFDYAILLEEDVGPTRWNAEHVRLRRLQSLDALIEEIERETARTQDLLFELEPPVLDVERSTGIAASTAPGEPWIRSIAGMVQMRCFHDRYHINRIREWKTIRAAREQ